MCFSLPLIMQEKELIIKFYTAFQQRDYKTMQDCYHEEAVFLDPVFEDLNATEVKYMWEMLCKMPGIFPWSLVSRQ